MKILSELLVVLIILTIPSQDIFAEGKLDSSMAQLDTYERINALLDSIESWSQDTMLNEGEREYTPHNLPDTLNLMDYFPSSSIEVDDFTGIMTITLPIYMDVLNTSLRFSVIADTITKQRSIEWLYPIDVKGDSVWLDNLISPQLWGMGSRPNLLRKIGDRLIQLRTLGLSQVIKPDLSKDDSLEIPITFHGKYPVGLEYPYYTFIDILSRISAGMLVYVGVLDVTRESDHMTIKYYMLITAPEARGHHFLEWEEYLVKEGKNWNTHSVQVVFTPYIRTDNLKNLFD